MLRRLNLLTEVLSFSGYLRQSHRKESGFRLRGNVYRWGSWSCSWTVQWTCKLRLSVIRTYFTSVPCYREQHLTVEYIDFLPYLALVQWGICLLLGFIIAIDLTNLYSLQEIEGRALRVNCGPPPPKRERDFRGNSSFGGSRGRERSGYGDSSYGGSRGGRERSSYGDSSYGGSRGGGERSSYGNVNKIYVGNLSWGVDNDALESLFSEHGNVQEARVVYDRDSGRSRGFGFVTYGSSEEVNKACQKLDGTVSILVWNWISCLNYHTVLLSALFKYLIVH